MSASNPQSTRALSTPILTRVSDVPLRPVRWLWPGRIPLGKLTLLMGEPGLGKSLVALDIAARLSKGSPWPDAAGTVAISARGNGDCPVRPDGNARNSGGAKPAPASVLLLTSADDPGDTIRPRLEAAGAILHKIRLLAVPPVPSPAESEGPTKEPPLGAAAARGPATDDRINGLTDQRINDPLAVLGEFLAATPDCRLIVIDPLEAFLDGCGSSSPAASRALLAGLTTLAEKHNVAILLITHINRRGLGAAQPRSIASLGLLGTVRIAWTIAKDADPRGTSRLLIPLKNNLGHDNLALAFHLHDSPTRLGIPKVDWDPDPIYMSADTHHRSGSDSGGSDQNGFNHRDHGEHREESNSKLRASGRSVSVSSVHSVVSADVASKPGPEAAGIALAGTWLREALAQGPMSARDIFAQAQAALGVCAKTVRRAAATLPIETRRDSRANRWAWAWDQEEEVGCHWPAVEPPGAERPTSAPALEVVERSPAVQLTASAPETDVRCQMSDVRCPEHQTSHITTSNIAANLEPGTLISEPEAPTPARAQSASILSILSTLLISRGKQGVSPARGSCPPCSPNLAALLLSGLFGRPRVACGVSSTQYG